MSCYYMFSSTFLIFWTNLQPIQASEGGSTAFLHMQSQFKQNATKMFGPIWSLYLVVLVCSQTFLVTHECMHIHIKKPLLFNWNKCLQHSKRFVHKTVCVVPSVPSMRFEVKVFLWWDRQTRREGDGSGSNEPRNTHAYLEGRGK